MAKAATEFKAQPTGQRVKDLVAFARSILAAYGNVFPEDGRG